MFPHCDGIAKWQLRAVWRSNVARGGVSKRKQKWEHKGGEGPDLGYRAEEKRRICESFRRKKERKKKERGLKGCRAGRHIYIYIYIYIDTFVLAALPRALTRSPCLRNSSATHRRFRTPPPPKEDEALLQKNTTEMNTTNPGQLTIGFYFLHEACKIDTNGDKIFHSESTSSGASTNRLVRNASVGEKMVGMQHLDRACQ